MLDRFGTIYSNFLRFFSCWLLANSLVALVLLEALATLATLALRSTPISNL